MRKGLVKDACIVGGITAAVGIASYFGAYELAYHSSLAAPTGGDIGDLIYKISEDTKELMKIENAKMYGLLTQSLITAPVSMKLIISRISRYYEQ